jgi:hypothetical protein
MSFCGYNAIMPKPKTVTVPHVEVEDGVVAFHKLEEFTRKILAVPKKEIDASLAKEKRAKSKRRVQN